MKYCPECGSGSKNAEKFCPECGTAFPKPKIDISESIEKAAPVVQDVADKTKSALKTTLSTSSKKVSEIKSKLEEEETKVKIKSFFTSKKFIFSACSLVLILILIFGGSLTLKYINSPLRVVEKFEDAITSNDIDKLKPILITNDAKLDINTEDFDTFIKYITSNEDYYRNMISYLKESASNISDESFNQSNSYNKYIYLTKNNDNKYALAISPIYVDVNIPKANTIVLLNGNEVIRTSEDNHQLNIGPLFPGNYKIEGIFESTFASANDEFIIDPIASGYMLNNFSVSLMQDAFEYVNLSSNYPEAKLYVNGEDTGILVGENKEFGPISPNSKLQAVLSIGSKDFKSQEVTYIPETYKDGIYLDFDTYIIENDPIMKSDDSIREEVYSKIENYLKSYAHAVNYDDFSRIENYLEPGSKLFLEQKKNITSINKSGIKEKFVAFKLIDLKIDELKTTLIATVEEIYDITNKEKETTTEIFNTEYKLIYNTDKKTYLLSELISLE